MRAESETKSKSVGATVAVTKAKAGAKSKVGSKAKAAQAKAVVNVGDGAENGAEDDAEGVTIIEPVAEEEITPLVALFQEKRIRILGTVEAPLFCASDVSKHIADADYMRKVREYAEGTYIRWATACDTIGRARRTAFFTEAGLYKYLLQSRCKEAEPFQLYVYDLLKVERRRTVDEVRLALKIEQTRSEELQREKAVLQREKTALHNEKLSLKREQADAYRMLNDMREGTAKLQKEKTSLVKARHAAEDAAFAKRWGPRDCAF